MRRLTHRYTGGSASEEAENDEDRHGLGYSTRNGEDAEEAHGDEVDELATNEFGERRHEHRTDALEGRDLGKGEETRE